MEDTSAVVRVTAMGVVTVVAGETAGATEAVVAVVAEGRGAQAAAGPSLLCI